jgi:hypothetical protein
MRTSVGMIVGALLFAAALTVSSWAFKGDPQGEWVDAGLYVAMASCFICALSETRGKSRCCNRNREARRVAQ